MGGMEFNKIFAAILIAGIVASFGGFVSRVLVHPTTPEEFAYNVAEMEGSAGGPAAVAMAEPILAMIAEADATRGERVARACAACHTFNEGGANGVGPNMWAIINAPKNHIDGYAYSGALEKNGGDVWTYAELNKFLWNPRSYAPGTKMSYAGLRRPEDRAALLAWLRTQAPSPVPLPSAAEIAAEEAELAPPEAETEEEGAEEDASPTAPDAAADSATAEEVTE